MFKLRASVFLVMALLVANKVKSQSVTDVGIALSATVQSNPDQITLHWPLASSATQHVVYRMLKGETNWGSALVTLPGNATQYTDLTAQAGFNYEYRVVRTGASYTGYGYVNSGIEVVETEFRGKVLLIVDSTMIGALSLELDRLIMDMEGDGWNVLRKDVDRNGSVTHVKEIIVNEQLADTNLKAVFLFGHIPVPYSGNIAPDGHPDHMGAWPADCYYGDVNGYWTDSFVTSTTASPARTQNVPGDGKFDQSVIPSSMELQVGRVDFANLPAFAKTETQLLKDYLAKDHQYRKKIYQAVKQAVVDDNFGYFGGEAFAASGYKNFGPLVSNGNISAADYFTTMTAGSYQWSYGCGGGTFSSAGGIGTTNLFATSALQGVFTMLSGSYFGDWDSQNNFLRAALAQGKMLANVWSGRPHYQFHHMGMGENIGYSVKTTQNYSGSLYFGSTTVIHGGYVHNALMGDPTLRNDIVAPVSNLVANKQGVNCVLNWTASNDNDLVGYHIYRKSTNALQYARLNVIPVASTTFTDPCMEADTYTYMVRAVKLETTPSGSFFNLSEGIVDSALALGYQVAAQFTQTINGNTVTIQNQSTNSISHTWTTSAFNSTLIAPVITYTANGTYSIQLVASNGCDSDTANVIVQVCHWLPLAQFTTQIKGDTVYFNSTLSNATSVLWNFGDGSTSTQINPVFSYNNPGTYTVQLIAFNSCGTDTFSLPISVVDVGVDEKGQGAKLEIYPNPAKDFVTVKGVSGTYKLYSSTGALAKQGLVTDNEIYVKDLGKGVYLLVVESGEMRHTKKILLE